MFCIFANAFIILTQNKDVKYMSKIVT